MSPDCEACSNPAYFRCTSDNICLHPELECDGHPQCPGAEDEDIDNCYQKKFRNKIETVFKCKSIMYANMTIFARRCNFVEECQDGVDEMGCEDKISNIVSAILCSIVLIVYVGITIYRNCSENEDEKEDEDQEDEENESV